MVIVLNSLGNYFVQTLGKQHHNGSFFGQSSHKANGVQQYLSDSCSIMQYKRLVVHTGLGMNDNYTKLLVL